MLQNYIKIAFRNLYKRKGHSIITVSGLTLGITACLLIALIVNFEWSYDKFHQQAANTYRVNYSWEEDGDKSNYTVTPNALAEKISAEFPSVKQCTQLQISYGENVLQLADEFFTQKGLVYVQPSYFDIFDYDLVIGERKDLLLAPNQTVLTQSTATKYFGQKNPIGQKIQLNKRFDLEVVGVVTNPPSNSHLAFQFFVSMSTLKKNFDNWEFSDGNVTYVVLNAEQAVDHFEKEMNDLRKRNQTTELAAQTNLSLQALNDIHSNMEYSAYPNSYNTSPTQTWTLILIALLILFSAISNFVNQSIAQASQRAKEIGVRKVLGSRRIQLITQFMSESFAITMLATILSLVLASWLLPLLNNYFEIAIPLSILYEGRILLSLLFASFLISLLAGFYPAFLLSNYRPIESLKGQVNKAMDKGISLRKGLIVFQLISAQVLLFAVLVVFQQMNYVQQKDLGFQKEGKIILNVPSNLAQRAALKNKLIQHPNIDAVCFSMGGPTKNGSLNSRVTLKNSVTNFEKNIKTIPIDAAYLNVFDIPLVAGKNIETIQESETTSRVALINEAMVKELGFTQANEALGAVLVSNDFEVEVIGVIKDFHQKSLHSKIQPALLLNWPKWTHFAGVKMKTTDVKETLAYVETSYKEVFSNSYFSYYFLDQFLEKLYLPEQKIFRAINVFALVALLIVCLGLFGLISITTVQRTKEIGIRKILGASVTQIVLFLNRDYIIFTFLAFIIAAPIGFWALDQWLDNFNYHIEITWMMFLLAMVISLAINFITVSFKSIKAAIVNPIHSLKND